MYFFVQREHWQKNCRGFWFAFVLLLISFMHVSIKPYLWWLSTWPILSRALAWFVLCLLSTVSSLELSEVTDRFWYLDATTIRDIERANNQTSNRDPRIIGLVHSDPPLSPLLPLVKVSVKNSYNCDRNWMFWPKHTT